VHFNEPIHASKEFPPPNCSITWPQKWTILWFASMVHGGNNGTKLDTAGLCAIVMIEKAGPAPGRRIYCAFCAINPSPRCWSRRHTVPDIKSLYLSAVSHRRWATIGLTCTFQVWMRRSLYKRDLSSPRNLQRRSVLIQCTLSGRHSGLNLVDLCETSSFPLD
jgi:hypothetical protein